MAEPTTKELNKKVDSQRMFGEDLQRQFDDIVKKVTGLESSGTPETSIQFEDVPYKDRFKTDRLTLGNIDGVSKFRYYLGSDQVISTASDTKVTIDTKTYDTLEEFDSSNNRFTATTSGYYLAIASVFFLTAPTDNRYIAYIFKNGSAVAESWVHTGKQEHVSPLATDIISLEAGDYLELYCHQSTGGDVSINGDTNRTYLAIHQLS